MDNEKKNSDLEKPISQKFSNIFSDVFGIFQSNGIRFSFQNDSRLDKFLLDYGRNFLFRSWILFFIIYLLQKIIN